MKVLDELRRLSHKYKGLGYNELAERWKSILSAAQIQDPLLTRFQTEYDLICRENPDFAKHLLVALRWIITSRRD